MPAAFSVVMGEPRGKGRPRFTRCGKPYTDKKTRDYENEVRKAYKEARGPMFHGPVNVEIYAFHAVPKSWNKAARTIALANETAPMRKPDADNIAKIILDALNGLAWKDDTQVSRLTVVKLFSEDPRCEIFIQPDVRTKEVIWP